MKQCPECFRRFPPDLFFCPHDGSPLRVPTGRLESAGATSSLPRIPWENDPEHEARAEAARDAVEKSEANVPNQARLTEPFQGSSNTTMYGGPPVRPATVADWRTESRTEPFEPIPDTGPIQQKAGTEKTEDNPVQTDPAPTPPQLPPNFPNMVPAYGAPPRPGPIPPEQPVMNPLYGAPPIPSPVPMPPEIPMMAPAYGGPPGRRFSDFGTLQPNFAQRYGLPVGFLGIGLTLGTLGGAGLMVAIRAGIPRVFLVAALSGILLGWAGAVVGWFLSRRG